MDWDQGYQIQDKKVCLILIDQGKDDEFLTNGQLLPDNFIAACTEKKIPVVYRLQEASIGKPLFIYIAKLLKS